MFEMNADAPVHELVAYIPQLKFKLAPIPPYVIDY